MPWTSITNTLRLGPSSFLFFSSSSYFSSSSPFPSTCACVCVCVSRIGLSSCSLFSSFCCALSVHRHLFLILFLPQTPSPSSLLYPTLSLPLLIQYLDPSVPSSPPPFPLSSVCVYLDFLSTLTPCVSTTLQPLPAAAILALVTPSCSSNSSIYARASLSPHTLSFSFSSFSSLPYPLPCPAVSSTSTQLLISHLDCLSDLDDDDYDWRP